jgi:signal transduction histidine kinase
VRRRDLAERILDRGPDGAGGWLESSCKLLITVRAGILLVTLLSLPDEEERTAAIVAIAVTGLASFVPLRFWSRVGPGLVRHPAWFAAELVLTTVILLLVGVDSPFIYYAQATALLGGLLYGRAGAALFGVLLFGVYFWVLDREPGPLPDSFRALVGEPALFLVAAGAGAATRRLLDRQAAAERALAEQQRELAAEEERARLARDMHDSLAKTVSGIGFAALALSRRIERDPEGAALQARQLAEDARQATRQAREIIVGLRADAGESLPLSESVAAVARRWADETGIALDLAVEDVGELHPATGRELQWIVQEALANVARHARASHVAVRMRRLGGRAVLTVADDGAGFEVPDDLDELGGGRHFGVGGMRERALLAGGDLSVESAPGEGCVLSVWVPTEIVPREVGPAEPAAPADPNGSVPGRSVPGYTWQ